VIRRITVQERASVLDPKRADPRRVLPTELLRQGRLEEARVAWQAALEGNPLDHNAWFGYAELCLFLGREDEYRRARRDLLARFFTTHNPYFAERTGRACLLRPATGEELRQAVALTRCAAASDPSVHSGAYPWFLFARGLAEYREGKFDQAISTMRGDASRLDRPVARLVLAMALHQDGQLAEARNTLAAAILSYDWRETQARDLVAWICHLLRREAEDLVLPNLPALLKGTHRPRDNDERLALLGVCQFEGRWSTAARLYAEAFEADPKLVESQNAQVHYTAACCAALAGSGRGDGGTTAGDSERARWRRQARDWLRADLDSLKKLLDSNVPASRRYPQSTLARWAADPALAGLRDPAELERLAPAECQECRDLWRDHDALLKRAVDAK
jgi:serine/threonine-protein kinase